MDGIFRTMCDVAGLLARGSDAARIEARHIAAQRKERAAASGVVGAAQSVAVAGGRLMARDPFRLRRWFRLARVPR